MRTVCAGRPTRVIAGRGILGPPRLGWWHVLLLASCLSVGGCALVARRDYFAVSSDPDRKQRLDPQGQATVVYSNLKPDVAIFEREGVHFRLYLEEPGESPLLLGPIVPVLPIFLLNPWAASRLRTDHLLLRLDVGGSISADRTVQLRFDDVEVRSASLDKSRVPARIRGLGEHGYRFVECETRKADLPSESYYSFQGEYWFQLEYGPGLPRLDSFEVNLGGVTVGGKGVEPIRVAFSRRGGWYWVLSGMQ